MALEFKNKENNDNILYSKRKDNILLKQRNTGIIGRKEITK